MAERNLLLIGQAEEIDLLLPEVRAMLGRQGVYLASDSAKPGWTIPLVKNADGLFSIQLDTRLDPERFLPTVQIAGPFYAVGEEQPLSMDGPVLLPACPFCGGPPASIVANADYPFGAAPLNEVYGGEGLDVEAYVFCHECGAEGPKHEATLYDGPDYFAAEKEGVRLWVDRTSRNRSLYTGGIAEGLNTYPRPAETLSNG